MRARARPKGRTSALGALQPPVRRQHARTGRQETKQTRSPMEYIGQSKIPTEQARPAPSLSVFDRERRPRKKRKSARQGEAASLRPYLRCRRPTSLQACRPDAWQGRSRSQNKHARTHRQSSSVTQERADIPCEPLSRGVSEDSPSVGRRHRRVART